MVKPLPSPILEDPPLIPNSIPPRSADRAFTVATFGIAGLEFSRLRQAPEDARWRRKQ